MDLLASYVEEERALPFSWSLRNCGLFIARWHDLAVGSAIVAEWNRFCSDEDAARAMVAARGGIERVVSAYVAERVDPSLARRGDIGVVTVAGEHITMICTGSMWAAKRMKGGVSMLRARPQHAWRVPWEPE